MTATAILEVLAARGGRVHLRGPDGIRVEAPAGVLTPDLVDELRRAKSAIVHALRAQVGTYPCDWCGRFAFAVPTTICFWCRRTAERKREV